MKLKSAAAATLLLGLGASTALATEPQHIGSDTLDSIMVYLFGTNGYNFNPAVITYAPQGSGSGENAIEQDVQEWAAMSRFLTPTGFVNPNGTPSTDGCNDPGVDNTKAGCWTVAKDSLAVLGNIPQSCGTLAWGQNMAVADANGNGSVACPGCVGGSYPFADWRSVLRIIYAGQEVNGTNSTDPAATRCNSDVRLTLVNNWGNLFKGGCATGNCPNGLKHAYRRDDLSGTTAVFLELLQLPVVGATPRPFCNGDETQDADPVRRSCGAGAASDGFVTGAGASELTVCGVGPTPNARKTAGAGIGQLGADSLGLVQPVLVSIVDAYTTAAGGNGAVNCSAAGEPLNGGGAYGRVAWTTADVLRYGPLCPNGAPQVAQTCQWPKPPGQGGEGPGFGCIANRNSRPSDTVGGQGTASTFDARVYNLWARNSDGTVKTYPRTISGVVQPQRAFVSYFKARQHHCRQADETGTIGCFVSRDACSIGFAGRSAIPEFGVRGLGLRSRNTPFVDSFPVQADLATYPLARDLYLCQIDGFGTSFGTQSANFRSAQQTVYNDLVADDPAGEIAAAATQAGFFSVPDITKTCCVGSWTGPGTDGCQ
jgi:hypothetical protein